MRRNYTQTVSVTRQSARVAVIAALVLLVFCMICPVAEAASAVSVKCERVAKPTVMAPSSFEVKGLVTSSATVKRAVCGVKDENGKWIISKSLNIGAKSFKLSSFNKHLRFRSVTPGTRYYTCVLTLSDGRTKTAFKHKYYVYKVEKASLQCSDSIVSGQSLDIDGAVKVAPLVDTVRIGITDSSRKWLKNHNSSIKTETGELDFSKLDSELLNAENLSKGVYYLRAELVLGGKTIKTLEKGFTVDETAAVSCDAAYPDELAPGKGFNVNGTVSSNARITSVKLGITNLNGKWLYSGTLKPDSDSCSLGSLNSRIKFSKLDPGKYKYRCVAVILGREYVVFDHEVRVMSLSSSGVTYPTVILKGKSFSLQGKLSGKPGITSIKVGVKRDGKWLKGFYVENRKTATSYDIQKNADSSISFGKLDDGEYEYACTAAVLGREKQVFSHPFEVTSKVDIKLSGVLYPPLELAAGKAFSIGGTITSNVEMSKVRVGIVDSEGTWRVYKDFTPKATRWSISTADSYIRFGTLPTGDYRYRIVVYVGDKAYTKINHSYRVVQLNETVSKSTINERISQLISALDGRYFTTDGKKASSNVDSRCNVDKVVASNSAVRKLVKNNKDGSEPTSMKNLPEHYAHDYGTTLSRGYSCCGFANFAGWYIFADSCSSDIGTVTIEKKIACNYSNASRLLKPGDILRVSGSISNGHSLIVVSVKSSGIEIIDCNSTQYSASDAKASRVCHYTVSYGKINYMSISRATNSPYL